MAASVLGVRWHSDEVSHLDEFWMGGATPQDAYRAVTGEALDPTRSYPAGTLVASWDARQLLDLEPSQFNRRRSAFVRVEPRVGHHYPVRMLDRTTPAQLGTARYFRCVASDQHALRIDLNHALSRTSLQVRVHPAEEDETESEDSDHWAARYPGARVLDSGIGFQGRHEEATPDWPVAADLRREDESDDSAFYQPPRFVTHIDDHAITQIGALYGRLLAPGSRLLDLMSSWISHLPANLDVGPTSGLGMNREELAANPRLDDFAVRDLNQETRLPYADGSFDAVICSVSFEYCRRPLELLAEIARVLDGGGRFIATFSNRCFPTKAIALWGQLHEFERMGLVAHLMHATGFRNLETWSLRGVPRAASDAGHARLAHADPVYAVWGTRPR